jgi:hypothetical protein
MVIADALENHRAANRRVANVIACEPYAESPGSESRRCKAATVVNAMHTTKIFSEHSDQNSLSDNLFETSIERV